MHYGASGNTQDCFKEYFVHWGNGKIKTTPYINAQRMLVPKHQIFLNPHQEKLTPGFKTYDCQFGVDNFSCHQVGEPGWLNLLQVYCFSTFFRVSNTQTNFIEQQRLFFHPPYYLIQTNTELRPMKGKKET